MMNETFLQHIETIKKSMTHKGINRSEALYFGLRDGIIMNIFPPGFMFPNEKDFCEMFNVGRSTLREAYSKLISLKLITRTKKGTFVNEKKIDSGSNDFEVILTQFDIAEVMELRRILEEYIVADAALKATDEDIKVLCAIIEDMKNNIDNLKELTIHDTRFHLELVRILNNNLFGYILGTIRNYYEAVMYSAFKKDNTIIFRAIIFHERIVSALKEKNAAMARSVMHEHLENVNAALLK